MKAEEAPEKIYVSNFDIEALPKDVQLSERWHEVSTQDTDIEYIKKDVFIEKVCKWLKNNLSQKVSVISSGYVHINFDNVIKEFRKYMEEK